MLEQDVPVPTVQVMVVVDPFLSTVTTPELALTPPVPAVTDKFRKVPARVMGTPADTVVEVQVPMAKVPRPCSPSVEEAVAVPVQAPWRICDPAFTTPERRSKMPAFEKVVAELMVALVPPNDASMTTSPPVVLLRSLTAS